MTEIPRFEHLRHQPPRALERPRELILVVPAMQSHVNLARIIRAAGCCGIRRVIAGGHGKIDPSIARDAIDFVHVEFHRTLPPILKEVRAAGFRLVGLEQATHSVNLMEFAFVRRTALVIGHERHGIHEELLRLVDEIVEIPVYGQPASHNAATAAAIAMYEYCRQFPGG